MTFSPYPPILGRVRYPRTEEIVLMKPWNWSERFDISLMNIDRAEMIAEGEAFLARDIETKAA
jgi:hypothetical protein